MASGSVTQKWTLPRCYVLQDGNAARLLSPELLLNSIKRKIQLECLSVTRLFQMYIPFE